VLAGDTQRRSARREHPQVPGGCEQLRNDRRRQRDLLEVVEHQEQGAVPELLGQRVEQHGAGVGHAECLSDRRQEQVCFEHPREVDEDRSPGQHGRELIGDRERQAGLAGSARPDERDEPCVGAEQRGDRGALEPAADERRRRHGQTDDRRPGDLGRGERLIVAKHAALEVLQRRRRLDAQLVEPRAARGLVRGERFRLSPGAIEPEDLLGAQPLPVRVIRD
jgi:hypothetical protein